MLKLTLIHMIVNKRLTTRHVFEQITGCTCRCVDIDYTHSVHGLLKNLSFHGRFIIFFLFLKSPPCFV